MNGLLNYAPLFVLLLIVVPYEKFGIDKKKAGMIKWAMLSIYAAILFYMYYGR